MPFGFVFLQNGFDAQIEFPIYRLESFGKILVYGALADGESVRRAAHSRIVFDNVFCKLAGALLYVRFQKNTTPQ